jgi:hypothetical protein
MRHNPASKSYNKSFRQLLHVGFKVAAKKGSRYIALLEENEPIIARNVTENLYQRHIVPVFLGAGEQFASATTRAHATASK